MENKSKSKKIIWLSLGLLTTGILGYFGWQYVKKRQTENNTNTPNIDDNDIPMPKDFKPQSKSLPPIIKTELPPLKTEKHKSDFPLQKGSKGDLVKSFQEALIAKYGKATLPKYGADGHFGNELITALKKLNLPLTIDQSTFNVIASSTITNYDKTAKDIYNAASNRDYKVVIQLLQGIKNKKDYTKISELFKQYRLFNGVRQTLVTGILNTFTNEAQKQAIRMEFLRMGLKYDGSKWSLDGLQGLQIITKEPTLVWKNPKTAIEVPINMVLGTEISTRNQYTLFENNNLRFLVKSSSVRVYT